MPGARNLSDQKLIARYLAGDSDAFGQLMATHEGRVFAICLRILGNREKALDATQETFLTVMRKVGGFQGRSAFSTWLYRVAVNTSYDLARKEKRQPAASLPDFYDPPDLTALEEIEAAELRPAIEQALAELPPEYTAVITLVDLEDMSLHQATEVLEIPLGTVKSRLFRGRKMLAQVLQNLLGQPIRLKEQK